MSRSPHGWRWALMAAAMITTMALPGPAAAGQPTSSGEPPTCGDTYPSKAGGLVAIPTLEMVLDERGWLVGHRLESGRHSVRLGRVAFMDGPFGSRIVFGEHAGGRGEITVFDFTRGCVETTIGVTGIPFTATIDPAGAHVYHDTVDPLGRAEMGIWRHALDGSAPATVVMSGIAPDDPIAPVWTNNVVWGPAGELAVQSCGALDCMTRILDPETGELRADRSRGQGALVALHADGPVFLDGDCRIEPCPIRGSRTLSASSVSLPSLQAFGPVPESQSETWVPNTLLRYRWAGGDSAPTSWMRPAIDAAASDVAASRDSRAATFRYYSDADDTIGIAETMSGNCARAIACATRDIPHWWYIRLRPHRTEMHWGTLTWCQAYSEPQGSCFDIERTVLHELGHVEGLSHPDDADGLSASDTVMHSRIPQRGDPGWQMHRFGPCDVATLQRRYDVLYSSTPYALCDRVDTRLTVASSAYSVRYRDPVTITATLRVRDKDGYGELGGNFVSGRDVIIQRRVLGGSWISHDAASGPGAGKYSLVLQAWTTYEFRAIFAQPSSEGLTGDVSDVLRVTAAPCSVDCPVVAPKRQPSRSN